MASKDLTEPLVGDDQPHAYIEMNAPESRAAAPAPAARETGGCFRPWPFTAVVLFLVNVALIVGVTILGTKLADRSACVSYPVRLLSPCPLTRPGQAPNAQYTFQPFRGWLKARASKNT